MINHENTVRLKTFLEYLRERISSYADPKSYHLENANVSGFAWWDCGKTAQECLSNIKQWITFVDESMKGEADNPPRVDSLLAMRNDQDRDIIQAIDQSSDVLQWIMDQDIGSIPLEIRAKARESLEVLRDGHNKDAA